MGDYTYEGNELEVFQHAVRWKSYFSSRIRQYLHGVVLEVGGGIGATARLLCDRSLTSWISIEPDRRLAEQMRESFQTDPLPVSTDVMVGMLADLPPTDRFDTILYVDVLEHIEDDRHELHRAASHLNPNGTLIVLAPAHQWLYTQFDRAIGHYRRYSAKTLTDVIPPGLQPEMLIYLDSVGMLALLTNRLLLRLRRASPIQIRLWDLVLVRLSRLFDPLFRYHIGKSIVGIWRLS